MRLRGVECEVDHAVENHRAFVCGWVCRPCRPSGKTRRARPERSSRADRGLTSSQSGSLATGKEIFAARCAKCHNESGDKPLSSGPPLNERALSTDKIARAINGRLRDKTEDARRAVTLL